MKKLKKLPYLFILFSAVILLSGWGSEGHRKINEQAPASLPGSMQFLKASWSILLADHASDADIRKEWDGSEGPRHYINIDDYPEFVTNGRIPMNFDSVVALHGISFVLEKGILPWATLKTFDSLRDCFIRNDWETASLFASDLGHYVADGHQPLHLTRNYDGQYSDQDGIHSRYETRLIGKYMDEIVMTPDTVTRIENLTSFIFSYIYANYQVLDTLLYSDSLAHAESGSTWSTGYYSAFWQSSKGFTMSLFNRASHALAALIYTAWLDAGSPVMPASSLEDLASGTFFEIKASPVPFKDKITLQFDNPPGIKMGTLLVYDGSGNLVDIETLKNLSQGVNELTWTATSHAHGLYYFRILSGNRTGTVRTLLTK